MLTEYTENFTFTLWGKSIYQWDLKKILLGKYGFRHLEKKKEMYVTGDVTLMEVTGPLLQL